MDMIIGVVLGVVASSKPVGFGMTGHYWIGRYIFQDAHNEKFVHKLVGS